MASALLRKSITDLSRRRSRTFFAAATLALAVASIGIFAMPALMDRAMQKEVTEGKLADVTVWIGGLPLEDSVLARLDALPNVRAVEPRSYYTGAVYVGERRAPVVESRLPVGSSARTMGGSLASARAIATRCCSPPDSCDG